MTYEAGPGLVGDGSSSDLAIKANRDPRMRAIYLSYARMLRQAGVQLHMHFASVGRPSRYGSWGLLEATDQDRRTAPKYQGLMDFIESTSACDGMPPEPEGCPGHSCSHSGLCLLPWVDPTDGVGPCGCFFGTHGDDCNTTEYVEHYDCGYKCTFDQGVCVPTKIDGVHRYHTCECKPEFHGRHCSLFTCSNDCNWSGQCLDHGICSCYPGFRGSSCEVDCGCGGHGYCADPGSIAPCICDVGYKWDGAACVWDCKCSSDAGCIGPGECGCQPECKYGTCHNGLCSCWVGYNGPTCSDKLQGVPNSGSPVGINLAGISYWMTEWAFVDVMKQSSAWISGYAPDTAEESPWDTGKPQHLRSDGYPARLEDGQILRKLTVRDVQFHGMPGKYVCLYDGDGELSFGFDAEVTSVSKV